MLFITPWKYLLVKRDINLYPDVFGHVEKWLHKKAKVNLNLKCHQLGNKSLQNTYCPISQEVKAIRQTDFVS